MTASGRALVRLILYGGQTTGVAALGDLWSFDPSAGSWTQAADPPAPPRQLYGLATNGEAAIVFGGGSLEGKYLDDTWRLDPVAASTQQGRNRLCTASPERRGAYR